MGATTGRGWLRTAFIAYLAYLGLGAVAMLVWYLLYGMKTPDTPLWVKVYEASLAITLVIGGISSKVMTIFKGAHLVANRLGKRESK